METVKDPFENSESAFLSTETKATQRRKRELRDGHRKGLRKYTSIRLHRDEQEDPDIQREIDNGLAENILYDSSY